MRQDYEDFYFIQSNPNIVKSHLMFFFSFNICYGNPRGWFHSTKIKIKKIKKKKQQHYYEDYVLILVAVKI